MSHTQFQRGFSLVEMVLFIIVIGIASSVLFASYTYSLKNNSDPLIRMRVLEAAQSKLDEILAMKYDAVTPSGGSPACDSTGSGLTCDNTTDGNMNDVDDFNGYSDAPYTGYSRTVSVATASNKKLVTVTVTAPNGWSMSIAAYRANF